MHHKFHTDALIVGSAVFGEANKVYELFTRDFGMIRASAQGVRLAKSKLKYALQDLSYVRVDLVQGKEFWRITSATSMQQFPKNLDNKKELYVCSRIAQVLSRLCSGEESHAELFDYVMSTYDEVGKIDTSASEKYALLEIGTVFKIVTLLGYGGDEEDVSDDIPKIGDVLFYEQVEKHRPILVSHINRALRASQLY